MLLRTVGKGLWQTINSSWISAVNQLRLSSLRWCLPYRTLPAKLTDIKPLLAYEWRREKQCRQNAARMRSKMMNFATETAGLTSFWNPETIYQSVSDNSCSSDKIYGYTGYRVVQWEISHQMSLLYNFVRCCLFSKFVHSVVISNTSIVKE